MRTAISDYSDRHPWVFTFAGSMVAIVVAAAILSVVTAQTIAQLMLNVALFGIPFAVLAATVVKFGRRPRAPNKGVG